MSQQTPSAPIFETRHLTAGYGLDSVLRSLDWKIEEGDSFAVVGPSGQGKSLFLKVLSGLVPPIAGSVFFRGDNLQKLSPQQHQAFCEQIGMIFQKGGLFDSVSCAENLRIPLRERERLTVKALEKRISQALEEVGLSAQGRLNVDEMSGGMRKRLGIARALLFSPRILLCDEPCAGLDPVTAGSINDLILDLRKRHSMTLVLVTSDLAQSHTLCQRAGVLWDGKFEQQGDWQTLKESKNPVVRQFMHALPEGPLTENRGGVHDRI